MIQLLTVIGARPQIIKAAAFSRAVETWNNTFSSSDKHIRETILHTGQHYDANMSEVFFRELGIPAPVIQLNIGQATPSRQLSEMIAAILNVLKQNRFDGVVIFGDTTSTLAGALAAAHARVPVFHVEAGLRSFNRHMPEEINRIIADSLASLLFTPTDVATRNLRFAGQRQQVIQTGDLMYDNALYFSELADKQSTILHRLCLTNEPYVLTTVHRAGNTDNPTNLASIFVALKHIAQATKVVLPLHPRTLAALPAETLEELRNNPQILLIEPVSFLDMIHLEKHATIILTDSGGVQKETFFFSKPCVILREETEWTEIVQSGAAVTAGSDEERILSAYNQLKDKPVNPMALYGNGHAAEQMVEAIASFCSR